MIQPFDLSLQEWMTRGGDARITLSPETGLNRYFSAPRPRRILAFASSTANDLSPDAHAFLEERFASGVAHLETGPAYAECLAALREGIRNAYALSPATDIFIAPSGTDLEYVGLLAAIGRRAGGIMNILLGADEVGSGCIHSAAGHYFAQETALGESVFPGQYITGMPSIALHSLAIRNEDGTARDSAGLTADIAEAITQALVRDRTPLVHVVHGSKSGLVLPHHDHIDWLQNRFGPDVLFVVDACQARISNEAIHHYLSRGMIVFITGSKFIGGPPFSGFALLPEGLAARAAPLPEGMGNVFRRAEVPEAWAGRDICSPSGNAGLALRLSASLFELSRFQALPPGHVERVVGAFTRSTDWLAAELGIHKIALDTETASNTAPLHAAAMRTLVTLDLACDAQGVQRRDLTFDDAARIHRTLMAYGIRLGQPVRCARLADGAFSGTLRLGLSMPQIVKLVAMSDYRLSVWFETAMKRLALALGSQLSDITRDRKAA